MDRRFVSNYRPVPWPEGRLECCWFNGSGSGIQERLHVPLQPGDNDVER